VILHTYLKSDPQLFTKFKPNSLILKKMNFDFWMSKKQYMDGALDFICFCLRFYTEIDYEAFSDKIDVINVLKRAEMYKCWSDLEELAQGVDLFRIRTEKK